ncbi:MAG: hypothetical protein Q9187_007293 [Circinaria calcarea]
MRSTLLLSALAAFAVAQKIDIAEVESVDQKAQGPDIAALSEPVTYNPSVAAAAAAADATADPVEKSQLQRRDACAVQPDGYGPTTSPDTDTAFLANPIYSVSRAPSCGGNLR